MELGEARKISCAWLFLPASHSLDGVAVANQRLSIESSILAAGKAR
jgi:hypothetical protein